MSADKKLFYENIKDNLPHMLRQIKKGYLTVTALQALFNKATPFESELNALRFEVKTVIGQLKQEIKTETDKNRILKLTELKRDLEEINHEIRKRVIDWPVVTEKNTSFYNRISARGSWLSAQIKAVCSDLYHRINKSSENAKKPEEIDTEINVFFDELNQLINTELEKRQSQARQLCIKIELIQKTPKLTEMQAAALKRLKKEAQAIEKNKASGLQTDIEAAEAAVQSFEDGMVLLGSHMGYGKKGLIEEFGNQILLMGKMSAEAKEALLFEQLKIILGVEKAGLDDILLEYIKSVLNPTLKNSEGTYREYTNLEGLYKVLNTLLKDPAINSKEIKKYKQLIKNEKSDLSVHLNVLVTQRDTLKGQVACLVSPDKKQVISEQLKRLSEELSDLQVMHEQTIEENETSTPNAPKNSMKSLFQTLYEGFFPRASEDNDEDNTPKAG